MPGFRPLTGILFFNAMFCRFRSIPLVVKFPSPYGDFVFQQEGQRGDNSWHWFHSFRPLTGILFFNVWNNFAKRLTPSLFPSPYGDFVFQLEVTTGYPLVTNAFPSPYGDFVFQLCFLLHQLPNACLVSVPLRGFCFSTRNNFDLCWVLYCMFPSPYGDFVFQPSLRKALSFLT